MKMKTLLCAAGIAALAIPAMAQTPVYSLNVVGYVNTTIANGKYTMFANQLDIDGTGTNNTILSVFSTNMPSGSAVYRWNKSIANWDVYNYTVKSGKGAWSPNGTASVNPGEGVLVKLPGGVDVTNTTVGTVLQGSLTNNYLNASGGYAGVAMMIPIGGLLQSSLNYIPQSSEAAYKWNQTIANWDVFNYTVKSGKGAWSPTQPSFNVGEGLLLKTVVGSHWITNFTVGP